MGVNYSEIRQAKVETKGSELIYYMPDLMLTLVSKYHTTIFSMKQHYLSMIGEEHIRQLCELTTLLLC